MAAGVEKKRQNVALLTRFDMCVTATGSSSDFFFLLILLHCYFKSPFYNFTISISLFFLLDIRQDSEYASGKFSVK